MRLAVPLAARAAAALFAALTVLSSCVVEEVPGPGPRPDQRFCTREYDPVCGRRGDVRQTFANSCLADEAGYRVIGDGQCRRGGDEPRFCRGGGDPVCATRGRDRRTFDNACEAERAGYEVSRNGECRRGRDDDDDDRRDERACTREYAPVCARRGADIQTFSNACEARSAEYRVIRDEPC